MLIPWPNRLEDGLRHDGQRHRLPLTEPELQRDPWPLVQWAAWSVAERELARRAGAFSARSRVSVLARSRDRVRASEEGLRVSTTATNVGTEACPYGGGAHPYLKVAAETVDDVVLGARKVRAALDERGMPVGTASVDEAGLDFRIARPIGTAKLDYCFTDLERGPDGRARVELHSAGGCLLTLWVDETHLLDAVHG